MSVLNWISADQLQRMLAGPFTEVRRHISDEDGRTVVQLRNTRQRYDTFRSLRDVPCELEQLTFEL